MELELFVLAVMGCGREQQQMPCQRNECLSEDTSLRPLDLVWEDLSRELVSLINDDEIPLRRGT